MDGARFVSELFTGACNAERHCYGFGAADGGYHFLV